MCVFGERAPLDLDARVLLPEVSLPHELAVGAAAALRSGGRGVFVQGWLPGAGGGAARTRESREAVGRERAARLQRVAGEDDDVPVRGDEELSGRVALGALAAEDLLLPEQVSLLCVSCRRGARGGAG